MTFRPGVKLDPSAVRDLRYDTRSEAAGTRNAQKPQPQPKVTSHPAHPRQAQPNRGPRKS